MESNIMIENAGMLMTLGIVPIGMWLIVGRGIGLLGGIIVVILLSTVFPHDPLAQLAMRFIMNIGVPLLIIWGLLRMVVGNQSNKRRP